MDQPSTVQFTPEEADAKNKQFIIRCFEILLKRMFPFANDVAVKDTAAIAEQAMTETPIISLHKGLYVKISELCPEDVSPKMVMNTLAQFSSNIIGAMVHKGVEIVEGSFTGDAFFEMYCPS